MSVTTVWLKHLSIMEYAHNWKGRSKFRYWFFDISTCSVKIQRQTLYLVHWHHHKYSLQSYIYILSIIVFLSTLKFLKLLKFNKRIGMLSSTLAVAAKPVAQFMLMFLCIFTGYTMMAYVLLNTYSIHFSSFITTMETLFSAMLSKYFFIS